MIKFNNPICYSQTIIQKVDDDDKRKRTGNNNTNKTLLTRYISTNVQNKIYKIEITCKMN